MQRCILMMVLLVRTTSAALLSNVLILDHLNINHERSRHDLAKAFYFDVLGCVADPRKAENIEAGKGTLWANAGIHQFHLSEGKDAQVLDGEVTLGYDSLTGVRARLAAAAPPVLQGSAYSVLADTSEGVRLRDPWGTVFQLVELDDVEDLRGSQPEGGAAEARAMVDLTIHVPAAAGASGLAGIGRFYEQILGMPVHSCDATRLVLAAGGSPRGDGSPRQTLTFALVDRDDVAHEDVGIDEDGLPYNRGAHISLYLQDMRAAYQRAERLGLAYVNHRFKRRAYTEEEAVEQCMFRMLDVVDPENAEAGPILRLEHEVRSATKADGSKYKSCPLDDVAAVPCAAAAA